MPDSYGKRQRRDVKAKKAVAREERRVARAQRDADRAAGLIEPGTKIEAADPAALGLQDEPAAAGQAQSPDAADNAS